MSITINRLNCRVRVETGGSQATIHASEGPARPQMEFAQPTPTSAPTTPPPPSQQASEQRGPAGEHEPRPAGRADPGRVAQRVYDLMVEEARLARMRGER